MTDEKHEKIRLSILYTFCVIFILFIAWLLRDCNGTNINDYINNTSPTIESVPINKESISEDNKMNDMDILIRYLMLMDDNKYNEIKELKNSISYLKDSIDEQSKKQLENQKQIIDILLSIGGVLKNLENKSNESKLIFEEDWWDRLDSSYNKKDNEEYNYFENNYWYNINIDSEYYPVVYPYYNYDWYYTNTIYKKYSNECCYDNEPVPEPMSMLLFGTGILLFPVCKKRIK